MVRPIIVDCDPGVDDAIALLLAFGLALPITAITTVAGNVPLTLTYSNAQKICALAGKTEVPVYAGCPRPLIRPLATAEEVLIEQLLKASEPIRIAALAPLTNLAAALFKPPEIAHNIEQLVIMGGAMGQGNITPSAEFNMYVDPHAAHVVLGAGIPTVLITLDTTHQVLTTPERLAAIRAIGNPVSEAAAGMLAFYGQSDLDRYGLPGGPLHDPCVLAYLHQPDLFTTRTVDVAVEISGEYGMGRTVVDWYGNSPDSTVKVVETVDAEGFYELLLTALGRFG